MNRPKVVIVGGGFGGLNAALALKKAQVDVLLIDKANHHLFQPLLYQVATASLSPGNIALPIRSILASQKNASVLLADIANIDKMKNEVLSGNGEIFKYDYLILAPGARHAYFGHPEWELLAPGLKTLYDALRIRERIILSYERAERCHDQTQADRFMRFIIVGAGPTGVEMAGAIAEMAHETLMKDFTNIKPGRTKIYLIEGEKQVLPSFPKSLGDKALKSLEELGVEVLLNSYVTNVTAEGVSLGDRFIESPNVIWAAGNQASALLKTLDVPLDRIGRVIVRSDMSIPNYSNVFVVGDAAFCLDIEGKPLPGVGPVAIQQARYVANIIRKNVSDEQRKPFKYFDKGMMATIGKARAVAIVFKVKISGFLAWLAWCFIHIAFLVSFSNKFLVMFDWFTLYFHNQRRIRLITNPVSDSEDPLRRK